MELQFHADPAR